MEARPPNHLVERVRMPCFGALREYQCGTRPNDVWPSDLREPRHIFPKEGSLVALAVQFKPGSYLVTEAQTDVWNSWIEDFAFNPNVSPWRSVLKGYELYKDKRGKYCGIVLTDTEIDPTVFVNLLRVCGRNNGTVEPWSKFMKEHPGVDPRVAFLKVFNYNYVLRLSFDLPRFFAGEPYYYSDGVSLRDRGSYNRPDNEKIFVGNGTGTVASRMSIEELTTILKEATSSSKVAA